MKTIQESVLLKTSSNTDVQNSGGDVAITGLRLLSRKDIISVKQIKYKVEVPQVVTVGATTYTPVADTVYSVQIGDPNRTTDGYQEALYIYSYRTPPVITTLGGTTALQAEAIHGELIAQINAASAVNKVTAATLGTGTGFTITDEGGYYPVRSQTMTKLKGPSIVTTRADDDGAGWVNNFSVTTPAVLSFGVGAKLAQEAPVMDAVFGNLISGVLYAPPLATDGTSAVSGQNYDGFVIHSLQKENTPTITGHYTYRDRSSTVYVDNGTGSSTTNLAGFITFEREMLRLATSLYSQDSNAQVDFFDNQFIFQGAAGAVPTATGANKMISFGNAGWTYTQIGSQTLTTPTPGNAGLILDQDLVDTEGAEYTPSLTTNCPKEFVVGKTPFMVTARINAADWSDAAWLIGFRRKAAHAADFNDYTDLAAVGTLAANGDLVTTQGILNNAATVSTSTAVVPNDNDSVTVSVLVDINGAVTCRLNGTKYPVYSAGTTALVFDAGDIFIPFVRYANILTGDPDLTLMRIAAVATNELVS